MVLKLVEHPKAENHMLTSSRIDLITQWETQHWKINGFFAIQSSNSSEKAPPSSPCVLRLAMSS